MQYRNKRYRKFVVARRSPVQAYHFSIGNYLHKKLLIVNEQQEVRSKVGRSWGSPSRRKVIENDNGRLGWELTNVIYVPNLDGLSRRWDIFFQSWKKKRDKQLFSSNFGRFCGMESLFSSKIGPFLVKTVIFVPNLDGLGRRWDSFLPELEEKERWSVVFFQLWKVLGCGESVLFQSWTVFSQNYNFCSKFGWF